MSEDLFIPKLGQTVEEVVLISWLVEDGSKVDFGDPVLEVETDKAVFNVEANAKGFIHFGPYELGETLPVLTVVATIGKVDESFSPSATMVGAEEPDHLQPDRKETSTSPKPKETGTPQKDQRKVFTSPRARKLAEAKGVELSLLTPTGGGGIRVVEQDVKDYLEEGPKASPVAEKLAKNVGLPLGEVRGTGPMGRITRSDVEVAIRDRLSASHPTPKPVPSKTTYADVPVAETQPIRSVRRLIFDRMGASVHETARVTIVTEADGTKLVAVREGMKAAKAESLGFTPGYNDLIGLIVARTLKAFPYMNARLSEDGQNIELLEDVNLGVAVDTDRGLVVPVIKQADQLGLQKYGKQFRTLVDRAVSGRPSPGDLQGGTFTITNLGGFEVDAFTPVINLPEIAILGIGRILEKAVPFEGNIAIRKMVTLSLVFDHRLVDGAPAALFLQQIKQTVEAADSVDWEHH